jgi:drug/metabolite transporter (DMT)-like permease
METQKVWPVLALLLGGIAALVGAGLVTAYFLEAVLARLGEPDQSLLFWYLPILFSGLGGLVIGFSAAAWGIRRLR